MEEGPEKRREKKLFRKKPLKSVGTFMSRILRTLGTFAHFGDARDAEDDDGGFRSSASREDAQVAARERAPRPGRETLLHRYGERVPGVLGLKNHGNTCFLNAVVQCLSNTALLAEYLGLQRYQPHLSRSEGRGQVTAQLATLVRALWTLEYTPQLSVDFKNTVSKHGAQFRGNSQHDALEFLLWLLDRVHEDVDLAPLNNNNNKSRAAGAGPSGADEAPPPDAARCQRPRVQRSFVQEHFQAQYKSSLTCPHCLKQSNTFDPFLCISLPIPLRQTRPLCVTLVFSTKGQRFLRVGLAVPLLGSVACLRKMVADEGKLSPDQVILTEVYSTGFQRSFFDEDDLTSVAESDVIYAFQAPLLYIRGGSARISGFHHSLPSSPYAAGAEAQRLASSGTLSSEFLNQGVQLKILLLVCNAAGSGQRAVRFGPPFLMREDRSVSWDQLQQSILSKLYYLMINGGHVQNARVLFSVRVVGGSVFYSYLCPQDVRPLHHPAVDRALKLCGSGGPPHVKLIVEWEPRIKDCLFGNIQEEMVKEAESVRSLQQQQVQQLSCSLDQCFQLYTKEEQLEPDDAWKCPHCRQLQQGVVQMSLWTLPDILILHLKRFRQEGERRNKLTTLVRFPLAGLDVTPHAVNRPPESLYDLYAVCDHHGGMHGGHYTASCRNSVDGRWYSYDDSSVEPVPQAEVCTPAAYILFYQRRDAVPPWSAASPLTGSSSSSSSGHWLLRLDGGSERSSLQAPASPESLFRDKAPTAADTNGFEEQPLVRGGRSLSMRSPTKPKEPLSKVLALRWSFGSKDRIRRQARPGELLEYLESGRRPRCTKDPIISLVATPPQPAAQGRTLEVGQNHSSPSGSSLSHTDSCYSPKTPEGQSRPSTERSMSQVAGTGQNRSLRSTKEARQDQGRNPDLLLQRGAILGGHVSHSAPQSRDSTLRRVQSDGTSRTQKDPLQNREDRSGPGAHEDQNQDLLSLLRPAFMKRDNPRCPVNVTGGDSAGRSQSNGSLQDRKANGTGPRLPEPADIQRAHSSSNIQTKLDLAFGRFSSLQRNGDASVPALLSDQLLLPG